MIWPAEFLSLSSVLGRFCNVQLKCWHVELLCALYGMMVDCFMPYSYTIMPSFIFKAFTLITVDSDRDSICVEQLIHPGFSYCFGIMTATANVEEVSVIMRIFSLPVLLGSTFMKSIHKRSMGFLAVNWSLWCFWILIWTCSSLTVPTTFTKFWTSCNNVPQ